MSGSCGCCACLAGAGQLPLSFNRPGLSSIRYRAGTHGTFFDAMIRRLTVPVVPDGDEHPLHALTTRERDDASIAFLDAWATTADVLTFYQERIANEAYLRTATERRSMVELGRLLGYRLKPGVAASVHLAYTLEDGATTIIPAGAKAQSIPGANEQPQMFETTEEIEARAAWNLLRPRVRRPQRINADRIREIGVDEEEKTHYELVDNVLEIDSVWIAGTETLFEKREPLLFVFKGDFLAEPVHAVRRVLRTVVDTELGRTRIVLEPIRPYYRNLFLEALAARKENRPDPVTRKEVPPPPAPSTVGTGTGTTDGNVILAAEAAPPPKRRSKKNAALQDAPPSDVTMAFASSGPATAASPIEQLLREILLGTTRTVLMEQFTANDQHLKPLLAANDDPATVASPVPGTFEALLEPLLVSRTAAPRHAFEVKRSLAGARSQRSDTRLRLLTAFHPELATTLHTALANVTVGNKEHDQFRRLYVLRRQAAVFGYNAPDALFPPSDPDDRRPLPEPVTEVPDILHLDVADDRITAGSRAVIRNQYGTRVGEVQEVEIVIRSAYGVSGRVSRLKLDIPWIQSNAQMPKPDQGSEINDRLTALRHNLAQIRAITIYTQSEELTLAQQTVTRPVGAPADPREKDGESPTRIELDTVVDGLTPGRWIIVRGQRLIGGTSGIVAAEVAMVSNVEQQTSVGAGGTPYSILELASEGLAYQYERTTVEIFANVVPAVNKETRAEILGNGSASTPMQTFTLRHVPLTFVAAPTVDGVRSTLAVRVNDALWQETDSLAHAGPVDRVYVTKTADDGKVTVTFGDGIHGQRLFSGSDNVRAVYGTGLGRGGNVRAGQIATAITRTAGMKDVVNPLEASGGADPEAARDAQRNIPVSVQAMGRVVSVSDYADFARTFAGIAKATATTLSASGTRFVHLTIGGAGDIPILPTSDLYRNLVESLRRFGNPYQPFVVGVRAKVVISGAARVRVTADHLWSLVAPKVRAALLETFSYARRDFGQPVYASEVIAAIQRVPGVEYVDLDELDGVREEDVTRVPATPSSTNTITPLREGEVFDIIDEFPGVFLRGPVTTFNSASTPADTGCDERAILPRFAHVPAPKPGKGPPLPHETLPAEIAYLPPELADLFILTEIKHD